MDVRKNKYSTDNLPRHIKPLVGADVAGICYQFSGPVIASFDVYASVVLFRTESAFAIAAPLLRFACLATFLLDNAALAYIQTFSGVKRPDVFGFGMIREFLVGTAVAGIHQNRGVVFPTPAIDVHTIPGGTNRTFLS